MPYTFLHMGCNLARSKKAAEETEGVTLVEQIYSGSKLSAKTEEAQASYFRKYKQLAIRKKS